jgi:hypothetical protein
MKNTEPMSLDMAAQVLGWSGGKRGERLQRVLMAKERRLGREILAHNGIVGRGRRYGITMAMLRRYCPEMFLRPPSELFADLKRHLHAIDERVSDIVETQVAPQLEELRAADEEIAKHVGKLRDEVESIKKKLPGSSRKSLPPPIG